MIGLKIRKDRPETNSTSSLSFHDCKWMDIETQNPRVTLVLWSELLLPRLNGVGIPNDFKSKQSNVKMNVIMSIAD